MVDKIATVSHVLEADQTISIGLEIPEADLGPDYELKDESETDVGRHSHKSLKQSCITRWSSILTMVDSVLCLWTEMNEALKSNGDREYCLTEDDRLILCELRKFLQPFAELTELVSSEQPHLALIPLIIAEVKDATQPVIGESECVSSLKVLVQQRLPYRIRMTEAVRIATLVDPSSKHLIAAEMSTEDMKNFLIEHTKQVISRTTAASNFTRSLPSTSESTSTDNTASIATGDGASDIQSQAQSQPSKKRKLLEKASQKALTGPYSSSDVNVESEVKVR